MHRYNKQLQNGMGGGGRTSAVIPDALLLEILGKEMASTPRVSATSGQPCQCDDCVHACHGCTRPVDTTKPNTLHLQKDDTKCDITARILLKCVAISTHAHTLIVTQPLLAATTHKAARQTHPQVLRPEHNGRGKKSSNQHRHKHNIDINHNIDI